MQPQKTSIPALPCPNCGADILEDRGFYNYCSETQSLCEHNYPTVIQDRIYLEHDESGYETRSHECELDAFCTQCDAKLPWALYQIRELDGALLSDAPQIVADLIAEIADDGSGDAAPVPVA